MVTLVLPNNNSVMSNNDVACLNCIFNIHSSEGHTNVPLTYIQTASVRVYQNNTELLMGVRVVEVGVKCRYCRIHTSTGGTQLRDLYMLIYSVIVLAHQPGSSA